MWFQFIRDENLGYIIVYGRFSTDHVVPGPCLVEFDVLVELTTHYGATLRVLLNLEFADQANPVSAQLGLPCEGIHALEKCNVALSLVRGRKHNVQCA